MRARIAKQSSAITTNMSNTIRKREGHISKLFNHPLKGQPQWPSWPRSVKEGPALGGWGDHVIVSLVQDQLVYQGHSFLILRIFGHYSSSSNLVPLKQEEEEN